MGLFTRKAETLNERIKNLRKKLGIDFIQTIRGVGYKIDKES